MALTKGQEAEMEVAELKMLRVSLGVARMDKIRNEYIRGTAQVGSFGEKTREARLRRYGHIRRHHWLGHILRMPADRLVRRAVLALGQRAGPPYQPDSLLMDTHLPLN